jgi:phenylacetate-CoA ligase
VRGLERARALGFSALDGVRASPVRRQIAELDAVDRMASAERLRWQRERLAAILAHARDTTPFYRDRIPPRVDAETAPEVLASLPIVDKPLIKDRFDEFVSAAFPRRALVVGHTNGSTGAPFSFFMDRRRRDRVRAETLFFGRWAGYRIGEPHVFLRLLFWHPKPFIVRLLENQIVLEPRALGDAEVDCLLDRIGRSRAVTLIGYPSVLALLARRRLETGRPASFPMRSAVSIGEILLPGVRDAIEHGFGCPVFERYSATEVGYIAHDCENHRLHQNVGSLWFEFPSPDSGTVGAGTDERRIVVTDLFNYGMPFLRYELADRVIPDEGACSCGRTSPLLRSVLGRVSDRITLPDGRDIEATGLGGIFYDLSAIRQFQLVQTAPDRYAIVVVPEPTFCEETGRVILRRAQSLLGDRATVDLSLVERIEPLPAGKHAYILSAVHRRDGDSRA